MWRVDNFLMFVSSHLFLPLRSSLLIFPFPLFFSSLLSSLWVSPFLISSHLVTSCFTSYLLSRRLVTSVLVSSPCLASHLFTSFSRLLSHLSSFLSIACLISSRLTTCSCMSSSLIASLRWENYYYCHRRSLVWPFLVYSCLKVATVPPDNKT